MKHSSRVIAYILLFNVITLFIAASILNFYNKDIQVVSPMKLPLVCFFGYSLYLANLVLEFKLKEWSENSMWHLDEVYKGVFTLILLVIAVFHFVNF